MKKSLIALFVAAFCFSSMAQVLVYDFSASFKRLDVKMVKYNYTKDGVLVKNAKMDSAKVVSDKFTGYMVIDACQKCEGTMEKSADDNTAVFYIVRKSDSAKNIYRAVSSFSAAMFGSKAFKANHGWVGEDKFTDALGDFEIPLAWGIDAANNGFLGFDNYSAEDEDGEDNTLYGQGYGKVAKQTSSTTTVTPGCDGDVIETVTNTCWMVKNLAGSVVGTTNYAGECGDFLFDVCNLDVVNAAVLPGTFTLKLNNSLTFDKKAFRFADFAEAETAILEKLKYAADDVIYIPAREDGVQQGLISGETWGE